MFRFSLSVIFSFFILFSSSATNYYISTSGSDAATGLSGAPKATLGNLFSTKNLAAGDVINIAAGTYSEKNITVGTDDEGFTILGATLSGGVPTTIFSSNQSAGWLTISDANNDNITISKIKVTGYKAGSIASNEGGSAIRCWINGVTGLSVTSCVFNDCDAPVSGGGGAIHIKNYSAAATFSFTDLTISNSDNPNSGAVFIETNQDLDVTFTRCKLFSNTSGGSGSAFSILGGAGSSVTFTNCLLYKNNITSSGGHGAIWVDITNTNTTLTMVNCTVYNNTAQSYYCGGVYTGYNSTIKNCIIYNNTWKDIVRNAGTVTVTNTFYLDKSGSMTESANSILDPQLNNVAADDYSLATGSRSIDYGTPAGAPTDDIRRYSRVNNPDAGAYESNGVALPVELLFFKGLQITDENIELKWATASEYNNHYFKLMRSVDGFEWKELSEVKGKGTTRERSDYKAVDVFTADEKTIYYKLVQVDFNGKQRVYGPIAVAVSADGYIYTNTLGQEINFETAPSGVYLKCFSDGTSIKVYKN